MGLISQAYLHVWIAFCKELLRSASCERQQWILIIGKEAAMALIALVGGLIVVGGVFAFLRSSKKSDRRVDQLHIG